jgi:hypothetical protein
MRLTKEVAWTISRRFRSVEVTIDKIELPEGVKPDPESKSKPWLVMLELRSGGWMIFERYANESQAIKDAQTVSKGCDLELIENRATQLR